ncbi:MAG TPA: hypothetical protein VHB79_14250 [Polyangiaceae bacterium]|nr:hypothetical protein [Polyangiaceae bacterium]
MRTSPRIQTAIRGHLARRRSCQGGFTLTELMVALSAGLFLVIVVFALSRDVTRFYQRETRVANATLSGVSGMERLAGDLALAGHLSTANITTDPHVCNKPAPGSPLFNVRALTITPTDATVIGPGEIGPAIANISPQSLTITGAISVPEVFTTATVAADGPNGAWKIALDLGTASARRAGLSELPGSDPHNDEIMKRLFMNAAGGRIIRLRKGGQDQYVLASDAQASNGQAFILVANTTPLQRVAAGGTQCGVSGFGEQMAVSAIDIVRYEIRSMVDDPAYKSLFDASGRAIPWEAGRTELVRVELTPAGADVAGTREIVAEYAVNLQFTAWRAESALSPKPVLAVAAAVPANPIGVDYGFTQLIRGVHVSLNVRSREPDREVDIPGAPAGSMYRIPLGPGGTKPFARVRTLQSDVALRNLENNNW